MGTFAPRRARVIGFGVLCCGLLAAIGSALASCKDDSHVPSARGPVIKGPDNDGGLIPDDADNEPPTPDASGLCGNQIHQVITNAPNIYFVFDASGSMGSAATARATRYDLVHE